MSKKHYEVVVGNVGIVYQGGSAKEARASYKTYVEQSMTGQGRAGGESVVLMCQGSLMVEHEGTLADEEGCAMQLTLEEVLSAPLGTCVGVIYASGHKGYGVVYESPEGTRGIRPSPGRGGETFVASHAIIEGVYLEIIPAVEWWQGRRAESWDVEEINKQIQARYPAAPSVIGVSARVLFAPLCGTYLCEGVPSMWLTHLDYSPRWPEHEEVAEEVREFAEGILTCGSYEGHYIHTHNLWSIDSNTPLPGKWIATHSMGTFASDPEDGRRGQGYTHAYQQAQGNHLV